MSSVPTGQTTAVCTSTGCDAGGCSVRAFPRCSRLWQRVSRQPGVGRAVVPQLEGRGPADGRAPSVAVVPPQQLSQQWHCSRCTWGCHCPGESSGAGFGVTQSSGEAKKLRVRGGRRKSYTGGGMGGPAPPSPLCC